MSVSRCRRLLAALLLLPLCLVATAPAASSLAGSSPFAPPPSAVDAAAPTPDATLELRGIMAAGDSYMFSIYDSAKRSSSWLGLNDIGREFIVRSYDESRDTVTVDYQGRTLTLALKTAKVAAAPMMAQPANFVPPPPAPQPIGGPVVLNPTPADEQRRLEAIAAEVNRRRMIRQQALQASRQAAGQGNPPAPGQSR